MIVLFSWVLQKSELFLLAEEWIGVLGELACDKVWGDCKNCVEWKHGMSMQTGHILPWNAPKSFLKLMV